LEQYMATTYNDAIQKLYVAYFNRPADPAGLTFWSNAVTAANGDTTAVAAAFSASAEYTATFNGMTNAQVVAAVYQNLFGRAADAQGAAFWTNALNNNTITVGNVVTSIAAGAQGTDGTIVTNKVAAATAFTAAVDTQAEIAGYAGVAANAAAKTWLSGITDSTTLSAALTPAALATTVAGVVNAGTPFSVNGALSALSDAQTAQTNYVHSIDVDSNAATTTSVDDITNAYYNKTAGTGALKDVADLLTSGTNAQALFVASTTTDAVRASLLSAEQSIEAANLAAAQQQLTTANTNISKVAGLSAAVNTLSAATTAETAANKALVAANADLQGKEISFGVTYSGAVAVSTDGKSLVLTPTDTTKDPITLATIDANGKATITTQTSVVSSHAGLTDLVASFNTQATAASSVTSAHTTTGSAQHAVDNLDVDMTLVNTSGSEANLLSQVTTAINTYAAAHTGSNLAVAAGTYASEAQIQTAKAVIDQTPGQAATDFDTLVSSYEAKAAATNTLTAAQTAANGAIKTAQDTISDLADAVAAMQTAQAHVSTLAGYQATVKADQAVLTSHGYNLVDLTAAATVATSAADIFQFNAATSHSGTVSLFGLQGADSVFVGSNYKMVSGAISDPTIKGDDSALEVFVSKSGTNTVLQIETHAYSSGLDATANPNEIVTITLTGVDASTLHLTNGIISTAAPATTA
jgi:hypothetical protein